MGESQDCGRESLAQKGVEGKWSRPGNCNEKKVRSSSLGELGADRAWSQGLKASVSPLRCPLRGIPTSWSLCAGGWGCPQGTACAWQGWRRGLSCRKDKCLQPVLASLMGADK